MADPAYTYEVDIPGHETFYVDSDVELTQDQAIDAALGHSRGNLDRLPEHATTGLKPQGRFEEMFGGAQTSTNPLARFAGITGRRVGSALDAFIGLPGAAADVVTGGEQGRLDALLRVAQGAGAPFAALTAPIEAAGEEAVTGLTGSEQWGRLAGDVTGMAGTLGLGLLAKAGKIGPTGKALATTLGVGRPKTYEEMLARDPHLAFVAERGPTVSEGSSQLEAAARSSMSTAELAMELKSPRMAEAALKKANADAEGWGQYARNNEIISEMPDVPTITRGNVTFTPDATRDLNFFDMLGTPQARAAALNKRGGQAMMDVNLTDMNITKGSKARDIRDAAALEGLGDEGARRAVIARNAYAPDEVMGLPEKTLQQTTKNLVKYLNDKFTIDREIALPRMRDTIRERIERLVEKRFSNLGRIDEAVQGRIKGQEVEKLLHQAVPDNIGTEDHVLNLFPGLYQIKDKKTGYIMRDARNGLDWKMQVMELAEAGVDPKTLSVTAKAHPDADLLRSYKGRVERAFNQLGTWMNPSDDDIAAAAKGQFFLQKPGAQKGFKLLDALQESIGAKSPGYVEDLKRVLGAYNRSFERWLQVGELRQRIKPVIDEIKVRQPKLAEMIDENYKLLWGKRLPGSQLLDNAIAATPLLRDIASPQMLERFAGGMKNLTAQAMLKYNPRFHAVNALQTLSTLWPIADTDEILQAIKLRSDDTGKAILAKHLPPTSKVEGVAGSLSWGPFKEEAFNQETAFLTMYNRARKYGFTDTMAADYARLRGNLYSQFIGLTTDQPMAFRKLDPWGVATMFQRFPIKQAEMLIDLMKDKNFPGAAKWLGTNLVLGGFKAATMGQTGWLSYKVYKDLEERYGKGVADILHTGLPSVLGTDISNSVQLWNPPFGEKWSDKLGNMAMGPALGLGYSMYGAFADQTAPDPNAAKRAFNAFAQRVPAAGALGKLVDLFQGDYNFKDPGGRLKWKGNARDVFVSMMGFRPAGGKMGVRDINSPEQMRPDKLDTFVDAAMEMRQRRDDVVDYAATRWGLAQSSGVDVGADMKRAVQREVDNWNKMWPEFPVTYDDVQKRAKARLDVARKGLAERIIGRMPKSIKNSPAFQESQEQGAPPPPVPFEFFNPGGG